MTTPSNLSIEYNKHYAAVASHMHAGQSTQTMHFTNGTYAGPHSMIVPTFLAGFQFIIDRFAKQTDLVLGVAINSDPSMFGIYEALATRVVEVEHTAMMMRDFPENYQDISGTEWAESYQQFAASDEGLTLHATTLKSKMDVHQSEQERAEKVTIPLALENPHFYIRAGFYDEGTPEALYRMLSSIPTLEASSLHKWDYGLKKDGPKIEGASHFKDVIGFPLPKDGDKALCHDITVAEDQTDKVKVFNLLTERRPSSGENYITPAGKVAYRIRNAHNRQYTPQG